MEADKKLEQLFNPLAVWHTISLLPQLIHLNLLSDFDGDIYIPGQSDTV